MKPKAQDILIEGRLLTQSDRAIIQFWSGQSLPKTGDLRLRLTAYKAASFGILLFMLGLLRYQE